jgi:hypothetical protein
MASDLDVKFSFGSFNSPCSMYNSQFSIWPPFNPDLLTNFDCFRYLMVPAPCWMKSNKQSKLSLCDKPGVTMWVNQGGKDGTGTFAFQTGGYARLAQHLIQQYNYQLGEDLFAAPYDWRLSLQALEDTGQFDAIAQRVSNAVELNCGKKAILLGHSMGSLVALGMLRSPKLLSWR